MLESCVSRRLKRGPLGGLFREVKMPILEYPVYPFLGNVLWEPLVPTRKTGIPFRRNSYRCDKVATQSIPTVAGKRLALPVISPLLLLWVLCCCYG